MTCFFYFEDDRAVDLDMQDDIRKLLFKHPQRLSTLAERIYDHQVVFDDKITIPIIELYSSECTKRDRFFEAGLPVDYFSYGLFMFVSERLKSIFDNFHVDAFYSKAMITLDHSKTFDSYYLFCPKVAIDAIDYQLSVFSVKSDKDYTISRIQNLVLDSKSITPNTHLFILANTYKNIRVISHELAGALISNHITGLTVKKVEDGSWMW